MKRIENLILIILQKKSQKFTSFNCETPESHCKGVFVQVLSCLARFCARSYKMTENNTTQQIKMGKKQHSTTKKHIHNIQNHSYAANTLLFGIYFRKMISRVAHKAHLLSMVTFFPVNITINTVRVTTLYT